MRTFILGLALFGASAPPVLAARLLDRIAVDETVSVTGLALDAKASRKKAVILRHIDVYAPGARILAPDGKGGYAELPRSEQRFFISIGDRFAPRLYLALEPDGRTFSGVSFDDGGPREFEGTVGAKSLTVKSVRKLATRENSFICGNDGRHIVNSPFKEPVNPLRGLAVAKVATHQAVVAVDTDNELMSLKFANNTTTATNYLAQLFAGINVFYERDLNLRLLQGDTFLRVAADPWTSTDLSVALSEVGGYWRDTAIHQAVDRAFVTFLSGKSTNPGISGGTAWILSGGNYCNLTGTQQGADVVGHYNATQVFRFGGSTAANDVTIVGHEIGHNLGADHTHCTNIATGLPSATNTIDQCFNAEADRGCYGGTPSCPTGNSISGQGTVMSYCNFNAPAGADCAPNGGQVLQEFHPTHQALLDARIATNIVNGCFAPLSVNPADRVFYSGFE